MSKSLKFFVSILLIMCFLASPVSVLATATGEVLDMQEQNGEDSENEDEEENENQDYTGDEKEIVLDGVTGQLELAIAFDLPILNNDEREIGLNIKNAKRRKYFKSSN